jgi:galactose mutarotase-like enzyme
MIYISNDQIKVTISEKGAELQSVQLNGLEYLWQADGKYWGKHSPVLFPVVGELRDGKYFFEGREYKLSRHGFARDKIFKAEQTSGISAIFTLQNDAETLSVYPFQFVFKVEYKLQGSELFCTYSVENSDTKTIYFSAGAHPAFKIPLNENLSYTDYKLEFNNDEVLNRHLLVKGLTGNNTEQIKLDNKNLHLQHSLFYIDAIVLKHIKSNEIKLYSDKDIHGLKFKFNGFPYFGIWAAVDAPFVCLEPWCGIADNIHHDQQLINKAGINPLPAGENWQRTWSVELF